MAGGKRLGEGALEALVLGGASSVWDDLEESWDYVDEPVIIAVNDVGMHYLQPIEHWVSLHPTKFQYWQDRRKRYGGNMDYVAWSHRRTKFVHKTIENDWGGSSGLLAVRVAFRLNCQKIILCGVPMDSRRHFFKDDEWTSCLTYRKAWVRHQDKLKNVWSMSGWTKELLGHPNGIKSGY